VYIYVCVCVCVIAKHFSCVYVCQCMLPGVAQHHYVHFACYGLQPVQGGCVCVGGVGVWGVGVWGVGVWGVGVWGVYMC
jgi:hypothetical protein